MPTAKELADRLNIPMLMRLIKAAENLDPDWEPIAIYPPEARQIVNLVAAAQLEGEDDMATTTQDRLDFVIHIINLFIPNVSFSRGANDALREAVKEQAQKIVERWEQDMTNAAVRARAEDRK